MFGQDTSFGCLPFFNKPHFFKTFDMKITNFILALVVALTVVSCGSEKKVVETADTEVKKPVVTTLDGEWDVIAVRSRVIETAAGETLPYVGFNRPWMSIRRSILCVSAILQRR